MDFQKCKILSVGTLQRGNMHHHTKFHGYRSNCCWDMVSFKYFKMAAVCHEKQEAGITRRQLLDVITLATFSSHDCGLWPMTLMFELHLGGVKVNQRAKYLGQRSFHSKVIIQTHRLGLPVVKVLRPTRHKLGLPSQSLGLYWRETHRHI